MHYNDTKKENGLNDIAAFVPIYNFEASDDILDTDFNGYRILSYKNFLEKYQDAVNALKNTKNWLIEPEIPAISLKYILVIANNDALKHPDTMCNQIHSMLTRTLAYLRLFKAGDIQLGTIFVIHPNNNIVRFPYHTEFNCFMCSLPYIGYIRNAQIYSLNKNEAEKLLDLSNKIEAKPDENTNSLFEAFNFFNKAKNTSDLSYKILNYVIFLERIFLADNKELKFRLKTKLVFLLRDSTLKKFISDIYDMRSDVAHYGGVLDGRFSKQYKKNKKTELSIQAVYEYIDKLDSISRSVANIILCSILNGTYLNLENFSEDLEQKLFNVLANNDINWM